MTKAPHTTVTKTKAAAKKSSKRTSASATHPSSQDGRLLPQPHDHRRLGAGWHRTCLAVFDGADDGDCRVSTLK